MAPVPGDFGADAAPGWLDWIERKMKGGRFIALAVAWLLVAVFAIWAVNYIYDNGVVRFGNWLAQTTTPGIDQQWVKVAAVVVIQSLALVGVLFFQHRRYRQWQKNVFESLGALLDPMEERFHVLARKAADWESTNSAVRSLHERLVNLEPLKTDEAVQDPYRYSLQALMGGPRVTPVERTATDFEVKKDS